MSTPQDPYDPNNAPPPPPPGYGTPPPPPGYGTPPPPPGYGTPQYGAPPPGYGGAPQLASWGSRAGAAILDFLITLVIYLPFFILGAAIGGGFGGLLVLLGYLAGFGFTIWNLMQQGTTGQTIGKKQVGIKLVREQDGQYVGAGLSVGRAFLHIVDSVPCIPLGYLWPLWDAKKQTFADKILTTLVIKA